MRPRRRPQRTQELQADWKFRQYFALAGQPAYREIVESPGREPVARPCRRQPCPRVENRRQPGHPYELRLLRPRPFATSSQCDVRKNTGALLDDKAFAHGSQPAQRSAETAAASSAPRRHTIPPEER